MARRLLGPIDRWLFDAYALPVEDLAAYRIVYASVALVLFFGRAWWTVDLPDSFWLPPPSFARFIDPPGWQVVAVANVALSASLLALLVGFKTPAASLASAGLMIFLNTLAYSWGKIDHDILMALVPVCLAFSGWGKRWSVDGRGDGVARGWCLALLAVCIAIGMFTAGWPKLVHGWLDPDTHAVKGISHGYYYWLGWQGRFAGLFLGQPDWAWEVHDWFTVLVELAFVACLPWPKAFRACCLVACAMHVGILVTLDIPFAANVLAYAAFFPLHRAARHRWLLPACAGLTLLVANWHGAQEFVNQLVTVGGLVVFLTVLRVRESGRASPGAPQSELAKS